MRLARCACIGFAIQIVSLCTPLTRVSAYAQTMVPAKKSVPTQVAGEALETDCARIDSMIAAAFAKQPYGSVTVGVVSGTALVWTKSYGDADMEKKIPADKNTIYRIGSITKMFTALMLEQLADRATVHLSDPVEKYVPEIKAVSDRYADASPITLIQLATHTSGLG